MAPAVDQTRGRVGRAPGVLFAEVALTAALLLGLILYWPASVRPIPQPTAIFIPLMSAGSGSDIPPWREELAQAPLPSFPPRVRSAAPVQLLIVSQNLHPLVESVGVDKSGAMQVPSNYWRVGWYASGPVPGDPGDAVIDGHVGAPDVPLVFARLHSMRPGDQIVVVLADGSRRAFTVDSITSWPASAYPPGLFASDGPPRLSLITCGGDFNKFNQSYPNRLIVEASYTGPA
jgi:Sortase domain